MFEMDKIEWEDGEHKLQCLFLFDVKFLKTEETGMTWVKVVCLGLRLLIPFFLQTKNEIIEAAAKTNRLIKNKKGNRKKEV